MRRQAAGRRRLLHVSTHQLLSRRAVCSCGAPRLNQPRQRVRRPGQRTRRPPAAPANHHGPSRGACRRRGPAERPQARHQHRQPDGPDHAGACVRVLSTRAFAACSLQTISCRARGDLPAAPARSHAELVAISPLPLPNLMPSSWRSPRCPCPISCRARCDLGAISVRSRRSRRRRCGPTRGSSECLATRPSRPCSRPK